MAITSASYILYASHSFFITHVLEMMSITRRIGSKAKAALIHDWNAWCQYWEPPTSVSSIARQFLMTWLRLNGLYINTSPDKRYSSINTRHLIVYYYIYWVAHYSIDSSLTLTYTKSTMKASSDVTLAHIIQLMLTFHISRHKKV
jgi:hypothetical protein